MRTASAFNLLMACLIFGQGLCISARADDYHDSVSGLQKLARDVMKAQKENNGARAAALLDALVLPNYERWYRENFDDEAVRRVLPAYASNSKTIPTQLASFFLKAQAEHFTVIEAKRFEKDCDDNSSEQTFNTLDARLKGVPLYELRFLNGGKFLRLFAFAYVDGTFRYVVTPNFAEPAPKRSEAANPRVKQGGTVQAAKLISKVQPVYPQIAREERLSGTVRLHAIVAKDGSVRSLRVVSGRCSLARASIDAVRKWRYSTTLLNGNPVEVDTTIDVIFELRQ